MLTIPEILTNYITAMGGLISFLNKKLPNDINMIKVKNLFIVAKNNETILFEKTSKFVLEYHASIANGTKESLLELKFDDKLAVLNDDEANLLRAVVEKLQTLLKNMNNTEWNMVSRLLKDLLAATSQHKILTKK